MAISIGQTSYSLYPAQASPGMLADNTVNRIESFQANETINPGRLCQVATDGVSLQQVQNTSSDTVTPPAAVGFAVLLTSREGTGNANNLSTFVGGGVFNPGDNVPVLMRGSMFAEWKGTTQTGYGTPNVYHSSTITTDRGKLTDAAASSGAGTEVSPAPGWVQLRAALSGSGNVALVNVNAPGVAV